MPYIYKTAEADNTGGVLALHEDVDELLKMNLIRPVETYYVAVDPAQWPVIEKQLCEDEDDEDDEDDQHKDAKFVCEVTVTDPDTHLPVDIAVFKDTHSGCMFAIDSTFIEQSNELEERGDTIPSPFNEGMHLTLTGIDEEDDQ